MDTPHETQPSIDAWQVTAFGPHAGVRSPMLRVVNEVVEALIACGVEEEVAVARLRAEWARQRGKGATEDADNLASELAGICIVLCRVASCAGIDLQQAVDAEMAKNRHRTHFAAGSGHLREAGR